MTMGTAGTEFDVIAVTMAKTSIKLPVFWPDTGFIMPFSVFKPLFMLLWKQAPSRVLVAV